MLKPTLLLACVTATGCATASLASSCPAPLLNWSTATAAPERVRQQMNILRVNGDRLLWNGEEASEGDIREYLGIISRLMNPQPLMILSYSRETPCERVQRARSLIQEVVQCKPGECLEVLASTA